MKKTRAAKKRITRRRHRTRKGGRTVFKRLKCSPTTKPAHEDTCFPVDSLILIRNKYNEKQKDPHKKINTQNPKEISNILKERMNCKNEGCWVKNLIGDKEILDKTFAPESPASWKKNKNEWLSDYDIRSVLKQYEAKYKCFEFIGPSPIDFDLRKKIPTADNSSHHCVNDELCKFNLADLIAKGKTKIAAIYNLDAHNEAGSHWVSLFINVKKRWIFYFNSTGDKIEKEIKTFVNRVIQQGKNLSPPIHFTYDDSRDFEHQKKNTECGMYSLYFVLEMLKDTKSPAYFKTHRITDEMVEAYRKVYFNEDI